jgi:hypothetical protein
MLPAKYGMHPKAAHMNFCEHYASEVDTADTFLKENDANITIYTSNSVQIADTHRGEEERKPYNPLEPQHPRIFFDRVVGTISKRKL